MKFTAVYKKILFVCLCAGGLLCLGPSFSAEAVDNLAAKLAILHNQTLSGNDYFSNKPRGPDPGAVSEFDLILKQLRERTVNSETEIADTVVKTWTILKNSGRAMTLLDVARRLSNTARNTDLFGHGRIDFRVTSRYWVTSILTQQDLRELIAHNPYPGGS